MASLEFSSVGVVAVKRPMPSFEGLRLGPATSRLSSSMDTCSVGHVQMCVRSLIVKVVTVVAPKYTSIKPLGDRVLVKIKVAEEKTSGGIFLPSTAQSKPQVGEVVAVGEGRKLGDKRNKISLQIGSQVEYSKYAGTELKFNESSHVIVKEDDIVGTLNT